MDLFSLPIITTAISLVICWAMFAILCSTIHEGVSQISAERGRFMKMWLLKQLFDHPNGINWASMLYMHGSIDLLTRTTNKPTNDIEPKLFAETLIEVVGTAHAVQMNKPKNLPYKSELLNNFKAATLVLKPSDVVSFYQKAMRSAELCFDANGSPDEAAIYNCLVTQIQSWYIEMGERLSYWYKKRTRARLFALGILIALIVNVDSVELFQNFQSHPQSKQIVINYYETNVEHLTELATKTEDLKTLDTLNKKIKEYSLTMENLAEQAELPIGWQYSILNKKFWKKHYVQVISDTAKCKKDSLITQLVNCCCISDSLIKKKKLENQTLSASDSICMRYFEKHKQKEVSEKLKQIIPTGLNTSEKIWIVFLKISGLLLSGLAASFGAPFWFDLLKKIYTRKTQTAS